MTYTTSVDISLDKANPMAKPHFKGVESSHLSGMRTRNSWWTASKLPGSLDRLEQCGDHESTLGWWWMWHNPVCRQQTDSDGTTTFFYPQWSLIPVGEDETENTLRRCPEKTSSFKNIIIKSISYSSDYANQKQLCGCVVSQETNSPCVSVHTW